MKEIRVLLLNGSPRANGNTALALREMEKVFAQNGVQTETVLLGNQAIRGCAACGACAKLGRCVFDDAVNELAPKLEAADGLVVASPVYYASANATLIACLDRLFYSTPFDKTMKVGASVVCARRGGCSATFDELNKYFTISGMPIASSQYWNSVHGRAAGEAAMDAEGLQTMRTLARNMTFLMKSIALGRETLGLPEQEERVASPFLRCSNGCRIDMANGKRFRKTGLEIYPLVGRPSPRKTVSSYRYRIDHLDIRICCKIPVHRFFQVQKNRSLRFRKSIALYSAPFSRRQLHMNAVIFQQHLIISGRYRFIVMRK